MGKYKNAINKNVQSNCTMTKKQFEKWRYSFSYR